MNIELDTFIKNISSVQKDFIKSNQGLILDLFEPMVFQMVLYTRMDTGRARRELGEKFAKKAGSQRIINAIDMDLEVGKAVYNYFNDETRGMMNESTFKKLVSQKKLSIEIVSDDEGLAEQEQGIRPSKNHPRPLPARHIIRHITKVTDAVNMSNNLETIKTPYFYNLIAEDIQRAVKNIIKKIENELFK